uniref:Ribosomal protein L5 n=1 Tax=Chroomonas placoidea TaxID=173977 RepID=A0A2P1G840_9CRYP|nr:ribosomal protein L5 [Chroomonas placoidea]AVM81128.1 ribosomal protein L5 [Chroomonas placoidea]
MNRLNLWHKHILKKDNIYKLQNSSIFQEPFLHKIIVNMNVKNAINDSKQILPAITALELVSYQKPKLYHSKKSIAAFKLRKNMVIGCKTTLQKQNLFALLDLLIVMVLPKMNNFEGFKEAKFKATNNINIGIQDLAVFPQINENSRHFVKKLGCNLTFFVKSKNNFIKNLIMSEYQIPKKVNKK